MRTFTKLFFFATIFLPTLLFGQMTWTHSDSQYSFVATIAPVLCGGTSDRYCPTVTAIDIYSQNDKKHIQTILPEQFLFDAYLDSTTVFAIGDMNFDGKTDIRLLNWTSTNMQTTYWYWFYNESTRQFQHDATLDELRNPTFDPTTKTIHTWWRDGFYDFGHAIYEWHENKLQLIAQEEESWGIDPNSSGTLTIKRNENGKISVTEREVKKYEIDYLHKHDDCKLLIE